MNKKPRIVLAAGGTGGHLFPAVSLAQALSEKGIEIDLFTDERAKIWAERQPVFSRRVVSRFTTPGKPTAGFLRKMFFGARLLFCGLKSLFLFVRCRPKAVVGFGGYPSAPVLLAARFLKIPYFLHECNATLGRANALLLGGARKLTLGFCVDFPEAQAKNVSTLFVGNPVRSAIAHLQGLPYEPPQEIIRIFVVGGSQGARILSRVVPEALVLFHQKNPNKRLIVWEQVRPEDKESVESLYRDSGISADIRPFFENVAEQLAKAHLVISRSGALTLAELAASGRPSLLVPLACSTSGDQAANAERFRICGASHIFYENVLSPKLLSNFLTSLFAAPETLRAMSEAARTLFVPHASERLADAILQEISYN